MQLIVADHFSASVAPLTYNFNHILSNDADSRAYRSLPPSFSLSGSRSGRSLCLCFVRCVESAHRTRHEDHALPGRHMLLPFSIFGLSGTIMSTKLLSPGATPSCWPLRIVLSGRRITPAPRAIHVSRSYLRPTVHKRDKVLMQLKACSVLTDLRFLLACCSLPIASEGEAPLIG